ncbi:hypothetical protein M5X00_24320 [Paenibacillus alvei]|uniref:Flp pilus-assembly TadG-like N-terminal domain-containing protein n=1 Tax=Paenibacillus alvei TaxID=44250 RepID=A0ABT4H7E1_PAEAL|nr:hypothetical protein [Paenibacillus alvei]EJW14338.1 hypothetical protein PAV_14c00310 [Paenibacillus alvei DSM 29]MCY9542846.1 hypothetical protein [Paenibacillus alvei]MCY9736099.1 hypothetical protein [Paenibacillus alvei]MCY9757356.1 hypothetical protein [Paenibacillus alvei]MCY9764905.1 hypothetical protein [Paenibacillus alvei]
MWFKVIFSIFIGMIAIGFLSDLWVLDRTFNDAGRAIEHSLDAGIIESGIVEDAQQGIVRLEESALRDSTKAAFKRNMKLDQNLENKIMKNSQFDLSKTYIDGVPWIQVEFKTHVTFSFPDVKYPITVNRKIAFESIYK